MYPLILGSVISGGVGGGEQGSREGKSFQLQHENKALQPRWCEEVYSCWSNSVFSIFYQKTVHLSLYWYKEFIPTTNTASTPATTGINIAYILSGKYLWITWSASTKGYNTQIKLKGRKNGFLSTRLSVFIGLFLPKQLPIENSKWILMNQGTSLLCQRLDLTQSPICEETINVWS